MLKKTLKITMIAVGLLGLILSFSNFLPEASAGSIWGTTTEIQDPDTLFYWTSVYGAEGMADRWLGSAMFYCLGDPSTCCVVIEA